MKTILISGGSRGIGKALVYKLIGKYNIAFTYNNSKQESLNIINDLKNKGAIETFQCDVSNRQQVENMYKQVIARFTKVDALVNCAGISQEKLFIDITDEDWNNMLNTNLNGTYYMLKSVIPDMLSNKAGTIVNVASIWGETGASMESHYATSKAAIIGLTKSLAKELGPSGIRVNAVSPGAIDTDMMAIYSKEDIKSFEDELPLERMGKPEEVADAICFLLENNYITGEILKVNGGYLI